MSQIIQILFEHDLLWRKLDFIEEVIFRYAKHSWLDFFQQMNFITCWHS